jgi:hypothetical protein
MGEVMTKMRLFAAVATLAMTVLGVGLWAQGSDSHSFTRSFKIGPDGQMIAGEPTPGAIRQSPDGGGAIISGDQFGFRLRSVSPARGTVTGTLVVKVGDEWYEVTSSMELRPATR